ncbi:hypothetical protein PVK06_040961 [Gossypium arboreum]|uniref:Aminotransferase-like plant mobile domain-containing protein n=1 Tax=Gossypium arboreum TaxID=29729 RepID=A0ABR0N7I1_GOSAR|nr:hypothetical protein PVK06_040961 [Gossypium arboreum]
MLRRTKLDPPLISTLVERWRPETHTFYLLYNECIITLKDVSLQLNLPIDGDVIMGSIVSVNWSATCEQLLGKMSNRFRGSRIEMRWLEDNFQTIDAAASHIEKEQFVHTFILRLISDLLMPDKSHNMNLARESVIDRVCNGRDARIRSSDVIVRVYTAYSITTLGAR